MKTSKATPSKKGLDHDVVLVHRRNEDGKSYDVLRSRNGKIEAGSIAPLEHGKPISGDVIELRPRDESPALFDVKVHHSQQQPALSAGEPLTATRPAQVATASYRKGWDVTFVKPAAKKPASELN